MSDDYRGWCGSVASSPGAALKASVLKDAAPMHGQFPFRALSWVPGRLDAFISLDFFLPDYFREPAIGNHGNGTNTQAQRRIRTGRLLKHAAVDRLMIAILIWPTLSPTR